MKNNWRKLNIYQKSLLILLVLSMVITDIVLFGFDYLWLGAVSLTLFAIVGFLFYKSFK